MLKKYIQNCCKPEGNFGYLILRGMNKGHSPVVSWAFQFLPFFDGQKLLDIGCGGGANIARLLAQYPSSVVDGVDYSQQSILLSKKINADAIPKRCNIYYGNVKSLPFSDESYDGAVAVETIYFWQDIALCFQEVRRILKREGYFVIVCELSNPKMGKIWSERCEEMTVYKPEKVKKLLLEAGFCDVEIYTKGIWSVVIAKKYND